MFLRYAYSPSFEPGWAIGVQLTVPVEVGSQSYSITEGFVLTKETKQDAYIRSTELNDLVLPTLSRSEISTEDLGSIVETISQTSLSPSPFPRASLDGALSALTIEAGDSLIAAEWNTEHPETWKGLESLHIELERLFNKYH